MELRFCMFVRRRRYGVTFLHIAVPAVIWTYVSACLSVAGEVDEANVAVARVSCILRCSAAVGPMSGVVMQGGCPAHILSISGYKT